MKTPRLLATGLALALVAAGAYAAGGKNQTETPIFGDGCVEVTPPGIDLEECELVPAPPQSGMAVYFCSGTRVIICEAEEEAD
jgi:hypothetical protein